MLKRLFLLQFLFLCVFLYGEAINYADPANWVIREGAEKRTEADLFYVLPTIFSDREKAVMHWQDNPAIRKWAQIIAAQNTGIFAGYCRVFAPYYRQAEFSRAVKEIHLPIEKQTVIHTGIDDVKHAFRHYLKHYNQGRPFILFGYSQGAVALLEVMKTELAQPEVNNKLVAAYLIGFPRMPKTFPGYPHLRTARGADDTGVIITYNSQAPGRVESLFTGRGEYYCINPVNWRTDSQPAPASAHLGSRFYDRKSGKSADHRNFVSAQIDPETGALIVIPQEAGKYDSRVLGKGVYHLYDLNFFYHDLAANGRRRIGAFWK